MIKNGEFYVIQHMRQKGMNKTQIAEELGRDRKTIDKWLREEGPKVYQRQAPRPSILAPYQDYIQSRMEEGCLNAAVLFDEIKAKGYPGQIRLLRSFMEPLRPAVLAKATERFETPPGKQAQVDWGHFKVEWNGEAKRLYAFVMVLGYSRTMYLEYTEDERLDTLMGCHVRAMQYFGGRTETVLYDNMKTVVTGTDEQGHPLWNERFARFAAHHGFLLRRCAPYRPRTKGKVENGVGYVRKNFWPRVRTFTGLTDLNIQARLWLDTVANVRIHGTTHEVPQQRLLQEGLKTFNLVPFDEAERHPRKVAADALISYEANRYSVPWRYVGQVVEVQDERNGRIRIYAQDKLIAEHDKTAGHREVIFDKKHTEGIRTAVGKPAQLPMPRLVQQALPDVVVRDLSVYEQFLDEAVMQ